MKKTILKCNNLYKSFGKKNILKNVSFSIDEGDILGFIGPNGAGKTTTIKLILGLQKIDSGNVIINECDIKTSFKEAISKVGAIVDNPDLYMYLSGYDNLKLIANMYNNISKKRVDEVIKLVKLENRIYDKVSKYSLGMRQRLGIAQAILHNPNLLILDEPTNGLDPEGIKELRDLLKSLSKKNIGILISSHNLSELESFCNKICIIQQGSIIETTSISKLKNNAEKPTYIIELDKTNNIKDIDENINVIDENFIEIKYRKDDIPTLIEKLVKNKYKIYKVEIRSLSLEEAFLNKTGGNKID